MEDNTPLLTEINQIKNIFEDDEFPQEKHNFPLFFTRKDVDDFNETLNQTRSQRIRAAIFPETLDDNIEIPSTQFDPSQPTTLQRLAEPSQLLKHAIINLINYQSDASFAIAAIPELIPLLNDPDPQIVSQALKFLQDVSKDDSSRNAIMTSPEFAGLVTAMVKILQQTDDYQNSDVAKSILKIISQFSDNNNPEGRENLAFIFKSFGIPFLIELLRHPDEKVVIYAITTLHNLLLYIEEAKQEVRDCGGIQAIGNLFNKNDLKLSTIVGDCLKILAFKHDDTKLILISENVHIFLIRYLSTSTYEKLLWKSSELLLILSALSSNKPAIVEHGAIYALSSQLNHPSNRLVQNCLWTLRNLSDAATKVENIEHLIKSLIFLLQTAEKDLNIVICASAILSNITCNNPDNKTTLCQLGGIEVLIKTLNNACAAQIQEEIIETVICTLRHITWRHSDETIAQNWLKSTIPMIVQLLSPPTRWPTIKAVIGLIRNLAMSPGNHLMLREHGAVHYMMDLLTRAYQDAFVRDYEGSLVDSMGSTAPGSYYADGVKMEEIVEGACAALQMLARTEPNRKIIREQIDVQIFLQLLFKGIEGIQRVAVGVLCEVAYDQEGAEIIVNHGGTVPLTDLLHSSNEAIATYAAVCLLRLTVDAPQEYKNKVMVDLMNFHYREVNENNPVNSDLTGLSNYQQNILFDQQNQQNYAPSVHSVHSVHSIHSIRSNPNSIRSIQSSQAGRVAYYRQDTGSTLGALDEVQMPHEQNYGPNEQLLLPDTPNHEINISNDRNANKNYEFVDGLPSESNKQVAAWTDTNL